MKQDLKEFWDDYKDVIFGIAGIVLICGVFKLAMIAMAFLSA